MDGSGWTIIAARPRESRATVAKFLKGAHRVLGAQHGDRAGQTNGLRPARGGAENDGRSRIQKLATVVFPNAKRVQATSSACSICSTSCRRRSAGFSARLFSSNAAAKLSIPTCIGVLRRKVIHFERKEGAQLRLDTTLASWPRRAHAIANDPMRSTAAGTA